MKHSELCAIAFTAVCGLTLPALGAAPEPPPSPAEEPAESVPAEERRDESPDDRRRDEPAPAPSPGNETDEKRPKPDYDGRGEPPTTTGDVLLWIPRVILAPPYFVAEYLIRRPLGFVVATAEREGLPALIYDFFVFGPDHSAGIVPTAFIDFGFDPSVGVYAFWNDAFAQGHDLRLRAATWGEDWLAASFLTRHHIRGENGDFVAFRATGVRRPDYTFFGLGPDTDQDDLHRYGRDTLEAKGSFAKGLWRASSFYAELALRSVDFHRGGYDDDDPLLVAGIARGDVDEPPGHARGYTLARSALAAVVDTRLPRPAPGSGVRVTLDAAHSSNLRERGTFVSYGASAGGYLDVNGLNRVISLSVAARAVDPLGGAEVPFTELATLGGSEPMRGYFPGRLVDRSALVADLAYRWPIWVWLDGALHFEVGSVFGPALEGFEVDKLRWSGSLGVESMGVTDSPVQLLVGVGSEPFHRGGEIDSLRVLIGTTRGF